MDNGGRVMEKFAMDKMRGDRPYFAHGGIARKHNAGCVSPCRSWVACLPRNNAPVHPHLTLRIASRIVVRLRCCAASAQPTRHWMSEPSPLRGMTAQKGGPRP